MKKHKVKMLKNNGLTLQELEKSEYMKYALTVV
jgi:hypothetical protein